MAYPYIQELEIHDYGCIRDARLALSPLHALIGPNDSGKSTVLRALGTLTRLGGGTLQSLQGTLLEEGTSDLQLRYDDGLGYQLRNDPNHLFESVTPGAGAPPFLSGGRAINQAAIHVVNSGGDARRLALVSRLRPAQLVRLDPDAMRAPSKLLPPQARIALLNERGEGLAAVLDALRDRGDGSFEAIRDAVCSAFPTVQFLQLDRSANGEKTVALQLRDGTKVPATLASEGLLYFLALQVLARVDQPGLFLIEEPENGLHPWRIAEVMKVLREVSRTTQVVIATHSPLVINELQPNEVSVVWRDAAKGTQVKLISETPHFEERAKIYALGELWLSYANGKDESPLVNGGPRQ